MCRKLVVTNEILFGTLRKTFLANTILILRFAPNSEGTGECG